MSRHVVGGVELIRISRPTLGPTIIIGYGSRDREDALLFFVNLRWATVNTPFSISYMPVICLTLTKWVCFLGSENLCSSVYEEEQYRRIMPEFVEFLKFEGRYKTSRLWSPI